MPARAPLHVERRQSEPGSPTYAFRAPHPCVAELLTRPYLGFEQAAAAGTWVAPPSPRTTAILNLGEPFGGLPRSFATGLYDHATTIEQSGPMACIDLKLSPLGAYTLVGVPMHELAGRAVGLDDLVGTGVDHLLDEMAEAPGWSERFDLLDAFLLCRVEDGPAAAPQVAHAWRRMLATGGGVAVSALAEEIGWSHRHLIVKFREQVGLAPKAAARIVRFDALLTRLEAGAPLARVAAESGYCDQSHLNRDFAELAGTTPTDWLSRRPAIPALKDGEVNFVQDGASLRI